LAVTEAGMRDAAGFCDPARTVLMIRSLQAAGWSLRYLTTQINPASTRRRSPSVLYDCRSRWVTRRYAERVEQVFAAHANRLGPSERARRTAARLGYYPPACYDDDWNAHPEWIRDEKADAAAEKAEQTAARHVGMVALTLAGHNAQTIADRFGTYSEEVSRSLRKLGIYVRGEGQWRTVSAIVSPAFAAEIRHAWHRVDVDHDNPLDVWADLLNWCAFSALCAALSVAGTAPVAEDEPDWAEAA
jgi:hypothetical protein